MGDFFSTTPAQVVLSLAALGVLIAIGFYLIAKVRATVSDSASATGEMLTKFRELHAQGELDDQEFRKIRGHLARQLQAELKDTGEDA